MPQLAAGLLMCRIVGDAPQFFLVHPGGPFFQKKDEGVWTIPKGLTEGDEDVLLAAQREFHEETGIVPLGEFFSLGSIKMKSGKVVHAWMFFGAWEESDGIVSNTFPLEWPPKSGKFQDIPEADRGGWFDRESALRKILPQQHDFVLRAFDLMRKSNPRS